MTILHRLRCLLISQLAGNMCVAINVSFDPVNGVTAKGHSLFRGVSVSGCEASFTLAE